MKAMKSMSWQLMNERFPLRRQRRSPLRALSAITLGTAALTAIVSAVVAPAATAFFYPFDLEPDIVDYEACATDLISEGVDGSTAADVCGRALRPEDLGKCVVGVARESLAVEEVLTACTRVRRPDELAGCFNDIRGIDTIAAEANVLDNCRRSLLPTRYANCVIGLRQEIEFSTDEAMTSCLAAGDRPRNTLPIFQPY